VKFFEDIGFKKLALGWPFYATWNIAAYALEQQGWKAKSEVLLLAIPFLIITTGAWTSFWLGGGCLLVRLAKVCMMIGTPT
jgi:hypothetical protein